jgi:uncharacterized protein YbjT (DUF2867 family)
VKQSVPLNVVLLGATGAVGQEVLKQLQAMPRVSGITVLTRRKLEGAVSRKVTQHIVDVLDAQTYLSFLDSHHVAICTLGVGQPTKVSREEFRKVDSDAALNFATACKEAGVEHFELLGSVAADPASKSFYLQSKGALREAIRALAFKRFSIFQPSMILTPTNRYGFDQALMLVTWPIISHALIGGLNKYRGIRVETLGAAMAKNVDLPTEGFEVLHWREIVAINR